MQRLRGGVVIVYHGDPYETFARIAAVGLRLRQVTARNHAQARLPPQMHGGGLVAALRRYVEPQKEAAGRSSIAVAVADHLIGQIELAAVEIGRASCRERV